MKEIIGKIKIKAYGKINLSLNINGNNGSLHQLDMITASISLCDCVEISSGNFECNLDSVVPNCNNTALRAAKAMCEAFSLPSVNVRIDKNIPYMAGMGGSSCDAAAVIVGLASYYEIKDKQKIKEIAKKIGSDVYLMMSGGYQRVLGTGEEVRQIESALNLYMLAVMGDSGVLAKDSYKMYDTLKSVNLSDNSVLESALKCGNVESVYKQIGNSLQTASSLLNTQINRNLALLTELNPKATVMFGSGAAVCGFFETRKQAMDAERQLKGKAVYVKAITTMPHGIEII